jgi:hypothetical protein
LRWDAANVLTLGIGYYFRMAGSNPGDGHVLNFTVGFAYPFQ